MINTPTAPKGLVAVPCRRFEKDSWRDFDDIIAPEVRISLRWPGREPLSLWAHPSNLEELALGHALVEFCPQGTIPALESSDELTFVLTPAPHNNGKSSAQPPRLSASQVRDRMKEFVEAGGNWEATGCFHRMGVYCPNRNEFIDMVEDIGRHNCIDRIAARMLARGENPASLALFISARATASLADKIARAGFRLIVSRAAVTTAGLETATSQGVTLAGFARPGRFTVFNNPSGFIVDPQAPTKE